MNKFKIGDLVERIGYSFNGQNIGYQSFISDIYKNYLYFEDCFGYDFNNYKLVSKKIHLKQDAKYLIKIFKRLKIR